MGGPKRQPAEGLVYRRLRDETPDDWFAMHSVGTRRPTRQAVGRDRLRGHRAVRRPVPRGQGRAHHSSRTGNGPRTESGSKRVRSARPAAAQRRSIASSRAVSRPCDGRSSGTAWCFPECAFNAIWARDRPRARLRRQRPRASRCREVPGASGRALAELPWSGRGERFRPLSRAERAPSSAIVAPSFDLVPTLRARIAEVEAELVRLTRGSKHASCAGCRTRPRALVRGGAGTGQDAARRRGGRRGSPHHGRRVLLCCRSAAPRRAHRDRVSRRTRSRSGATASCSTSSSTRRIGGQASRTPTRRRPERSSCPEQAIEAISSLDRIGSFDALVRRRGQDLMLDGALDVFDALLAGGLDKGLLEGLPRPQAERLRRRGSARSTTGSLRRRRRSSSCSRTAATRLRSAT